MYGGRLQSRDTGIFSDHLFAVLRFAVLTPCCLCAASRLKTTSEASKTKRRSRDQDPRTATEGSRTLPPELCALWRDPNQFDASFLANVSCIGFIDWVIPVFMDPEAWNRGSGAVGIIFYVIGPIF